MIRPTISVVPPGAKGTMRVTGLFGQSSACAKLDMTKPDASNAPTKIMLRTGLAKRIMMSSNFSMAQSATAALREAANSPPLPSADP
jgi:hypothetical protein